MKKKLVGDLFPKRKFDVSCPCGHRFVVKMHTWNPVWPMCPLCDRFFLLKTDTGTPRLVPVSEFI